ncbi:MAG: hypothetical protein WCB55_22350, partial [Pseudolabrys sp.]
MRATKHSPRTDLVAVLSGAPVEGLSAPLCFFVSVTLRFAVTGAGSSNVRTGRASDRLEGTHGASAYFTIVLGASPEF